MAVHKEYWLLYDVWTIFRCYTNNFARLFPILNMLQLNWITWTDNELGLYFVFCRLNLFDDIFFSFTQQVFDGNINKVDIVESRFYQSIQAVKVRIVPLQFYQAIAFRFELLGCKQFWRSWDSSILSRDKINNRRLGFCHMTLCRLYSEMTAILNAVCGSREGA